MNAVFILLTLSALIGFALGKSFSWPAVAGASIGIAVLSSVTLQILGFGAVSGIAIVFVCLTLSQVAYVAADWVSRPEARRRDDDVAREQQQKAPSWLA
jgi:hypothetical protein